MSMSQEKPDSGVAGQLEWSPRPLAVDAGNLPASPLVMERLLRLVRHEQGAEHLSVDDEGGVQIEDLDSAELDALRLSILNDDPRELAQELAFQAMECGDPDQATQFVAQALATDPHCVDALTTRAFLSCETAAELIRQLNHAATVGERNLGEDFFDEFLGDFWPMVEARPYLRTIKQLAEVLWGSGQRLDAVEHFENLLDLDPDDHLGHTRLLLASYLTMGEVGRSWELLEEYDDPDEAIWQWGWVLVRFLAGEVDAAARILERARALNPFVERYLTGAASTPDEVEPYFTRGEESEAVACAQILGEAWAVNTPALFWLLETVTDAEESDDDDGSNDLESDTIH